MKKTNRTLNRLVLLLTGLLLAIAAALVLLPMLPVQFDPVQQVLQAAQRQWQVLDDQQLQIGSRQQVPASLAVLVGAAVVVIVLLAVFVSTRRSRTRRTAAEFSQPDGRTVADRRVVAALIAEPIEARADVIAARTTVRTWKKAPALEVEIRVRRGADLARVLGDAQQRLAEWESLSGERMPVLVHLADRSWADGFRSTAPAAR